MDLKEFVELEPKFESLSPKEKIKLFFWFLHTHKAANVIDNEAIRNCFKQLHLPTNTVAVYLPRMAASKPPDLLKEGSGYRLARSAKTQLDRRYGQSPATIQVSRILTDLPEQLPDLGERDFLREAISCYRIGAFRSCVVMTWNLAFDHLLRWVYNEPTRLSAFNAAIPRRYPKKAPLTINSINDFEELKESEFIEVAQNAGLLSKNLTEILREKLKKRNISAHPSRIMVVQSQADDVITDLVNNVLLNLPA